MSNAEKKCFIITPIGGDNSEIRRAAEGVIDAVIVPALTELRFQAQNIAVAHRMPNPGSINKQIIKRILEDDLVITNLTTLNPNVMYELALRHAIRKPVIQICEEGTKLPFDIVEERTVFYTNDMLGSVQLKEKLIQIIPEALNDEKPDNPIYRVVESQIIQASTSISDTDKFLISRIDKLESLILNTYKNEPTVRNRKRLGDFQTLTITGKRIFNFEPKQIVDSLLAVIPGKVHIVAGEFGETSIVLTIETENNLFKFDNYIKSSLADYIADIDVVYSRSV
ncbi:hypothetical protein [Paenibacillus koleovorans]|uniref:hypothetical protein n=1 Tax=Paenibacillus koleovorans TaxID=121608 RepID=UPI000FD78B67|nr:hypothetical protein [Paenibacillus koleovorans]